MIDDFKRICLDEYEIFSYIDRGCFHKFLTKSVNVGELDRKLYRVGQELASHRNPSPMPGYGQIYVNDLNDVGGKEAKLWYVGGDGDEKGFGDIVKESLKEAFPAVSEIRYEAEYFPPKDEGWRQVYPREVDV